MSLTHPFLDEWCNDGGHYAHYSDCQTADSTFYGTHLYRTGCPQSVRSGAKSQPFGYLTVYTYFTQYERAYQSAEDTAYYYKDTFADGVAVRTAGRVTFEIVRSLGCEWATVPEGQICSEMLELYQTDGVIAEPAGALAPAALRSVVSVEPGQRVVAVVSGGNNDVSRYSEIVERSLIFEGRKHYFLVTFPQEPGALRRFLDEILGPEDDITYFQYVKRSNREVGPAMVGVELGDPGSFPALLQRLRHSPLQVEVLDPDSPVYRFLV